MNTFADIRYIISHKGQADSPMVKAFARHDGKTWLHYSDDAGLDDIIRDLVKEGVESKHVVILKEFKGRFFQKCPGSPGMICCNYLVMNTCFNCLYGCTYCFLNSYLNSYGIMQFTNTGLLTEELRKFIQSSPRDMVYRIGTGEFTDSLMFDEVTGIAEGLIAETAPHANIMLELKTKSRNVDHLLGIAEKGNAVISWTLGPERNIGLYEKGSATLGERLSAAGKASESGFFVAFHFDPVILYEGWKRDYGELLERLFGSIDPGRVPWISMGGFRYAPGFRNALKTVSPGEDLTLGEMFPGPDGKFRYFKPQRVDMYKFLLDRLARYTSEPFIYLCMESAGVWFETTGRSYSTSEDLERHFSESMWQFLKAKKHYTV